MVGSQNLGTSTELSVLMPIKKGFIQAPLSITYATRIRMVLNTLHQGRKVFLESELQSAISGPLERLRVLESVRWCILENDTRLLLAVSFKGPWEPYIRVIQRHAGKILDAILCNCEGYEAEHRSELGFPAFARWVRKYQIRSEQFFSSSPDLTTDDLQYLRMLATSQRNDGDSVSFDARATQQTLLSPEQLAKPVAVLEPALYAQQWLKILNAFHFLHKYFPDGPDPLTGTPRFDGHFLRELTRSVLNGPEPLYELPQALRDLNKGPLDWLELKRPDIELPPQPSNAGEPERKNVQSGILSRFETVTAGEDSNATHTRGALLFLRFPTAQGGKDFLKAIAPRITSEADRNKKFTLNVALSCAGLKALGLTQEHLAEFPREFSEGMEARAGSLGDVRSNHPRNWRHQQLAGAVCPDLRAEPSTIDCVLQWQSLTKEFDESRIPLQGVAIVARQELRRHADAYGNYQGHFDFIEGFSQPRDPFRNPSRDYPHDVVKGGDLLLGYVNKHGDAIACSELLVDGTFMALRKLRQDVGAFRRFVSTASEAAKIAPETVKAKMMGRYADGTALIASARKKNDFDYTHDPAGLQCPLHAHIRRTNPRTEEAPRIVRRGFSYGKPYDEDPFDTDRGMMFMAYCASLADQFELIQQWANGGNSTGILSAEADPILGIAEPHKPRTLRFEHNGRIERFDMNEPKPSTQFVTLEWGLYFFVPSIAAVRKLAEYASVATQDLPEELIEKASKTIDQLMVLEELWRHTPPRTNEDPALRWKQLLEDPSARESGMTQAIWQVIRARGGTLNTSYGTLIGDRKAVMDALCNEGDKYSVRRYWERMDKTIGAGFLGMDPAPISIGTAGTPDDRKLDADYITALNTRGYADEAPCPNRAIAAVTEPQAFELAVKVARAFLQQEKIRQQVTGKCVINLEQFFEVILARLSEQWFGMPANVQTKTFDELEGEYARPRNFVALGSYIFNAEPTEYIAVAAVQAGKAIKQVAAATIASTKVNTPILNAIRACSGDADYKTRTLGGIIQGFITPTYGSLVSVFLRLINEKILWRLQQEWIGAKPDDKSAYANAQKVLRTPLIDAMRAGPVPAQLHRVASSDSPDKKINTCDRVILGLASAMRESNDPSRTALLFGGDYGVTCSAKTSHPCPGRDMALGVMLGILAVVLNSGGLIQSGALSLDTA
jgi:Dyp-type peroxidase family